MNGHPNIVYVSTDGGVTWTPLHEFVQVRFIIHLYFINTYKKCALDAFGIKYMPYEFLPEVMFCHGMLREV